MRGARPDNRWACAPHGEAAMKCSEVMKRDVLTARADDSLQAVALAMLQHGVSFVPILDSERRMVGAVTERVLLAQVVASGRTSLDIKAGNVAHELPLVGPDDEHGAAEAKMAEKQIARAGVVDSEGRFLGVVTLASLAEKVGSQEAGNLLKSLRRTEV
jgi:CBS-domain-containing membrane protein